MTGLHTRYRTIVMIGGVALVMIAIVLAITAGRDRATGEPPPSQVGGTSEPTPHASLPTDAESGPAVADDEPAGLQRLPDTDDPDVYAAAVTAALHSMDHARERAADYEALFAAALWDEIAPDSREAILAAIYARIPDERMWQQQAAVSQRAVFELDEVWEPRLGQQGREQQWWPPGVVVRTVTGTVTEAWQPPDTNKPQSSSRSVALTVVAACPPAASPCRLVGIQPSVEA